jgi:hypothetical protein
VASPLELQFGQTPGLTQDISTMTLPGASVLLLLVILGDMRESDGPAGCAGPSPSYSAGLEFELTGVAQSVELA